MWIYGVFYVSVIKKLNLSIPIKVWGPRELDYAVHDLETWRCFFFSQKGKRRRCFLLV